MTLLSHFASTAKNNLDAVDNVDRLYPGNLRYYLQVLMLRATNLRNAYHNASHILHVLWACYQACLYYRNTLSPRRIRNLLIAAIFHDFNHSGKVGNDPQEIKAAITALRELIHDEDRTELPNIEAIIDATEFNGKPKQINNPTLEQDIIRDVDISQGLLDVWVQQVLFGLGSEMNKGVVDMLKMQEPFLRSIQFRTDWAKTTFTQEHIDQKINEARRWLEIMTENHTSGLSKP